MRIVLYGSREDCESLIICANALLELQYRVIKYDYTDNYDDFLSMLKKDTLDVVIVLTNGAEGMEGVIASKGLHSDIPVIWFSNDAGFGAQAHRLGCTYFGAKPVTGEKLFNAYAAYRRETVKNIKA